MGNLKFGDISTQDLDLIIQYIPSYDFPEQDTETFHIPGKNGDLVINSGSFKNTTRSYSIASIFKPGTDFIANSEKLINWLTAHPGYHRLEDTYDPNVYRLAIFRSKGTLPNYYNKATVFNVTFECMPQRYLKIGEKVTIYSFAGVANLQNISINIVNPTEYKALPEITLKNIPDSGENVLMFNVINYNEEVTSSIILDSIPNDSMTFDSEHQIVYAIQNGMTKNLSRYVHLNGKPFPSLDSNKNTIEIKKYSKVKNTIDKFNTLIDNKKQVLFAKYLPFETVLQSKESKADIKSFDSIKNSKMETFDAEAYTNLALDNAEYAEMRSFNEVLQQTCFMLGFNLDRFKGPDSKKINIIRQTYGSPTGGSPVYYIEINGQYNPQPSQIYTIDGTIAIFYNQDKASYSIFILRPLVDKNGNPVNEENQSALYDGAFLQLKDNTDNTYNSNKIIRCPSTTLSEIISNKDNIYNDSTYLDILKVFSLRGLSKKSFKKMKDLDTNHDIVLSLYPSKLENSKHVLDINYEAPSWIDIGLIYGGVDDYPTIDEVLYKPALSGYYYKQQSDSGSGLLSGLVGGLGGLISKLFNKSGWNKIIVDPQSDTKALEEVKWDSNKQAFVLGSLLSTNENYTVARYFIPLDLLPQYKDEVLQNVYETDDKGNVKTDVAGNKINKVIKNRIDILSVNDSFTKITGIKIKESGYYSFNEDSNNNPNEWHYYAAETSLETGSFPIGFKDSCTDANKIHYLSSIPDYREEENFPEWLDPIPILLDSAGDEIRPEDINDRINAARYTFKTKKAGWYWYEFKEDDTTKRTVWVPLAADSKITHLDPDPTLEDGKTSDENFIIHFTNYKVDWENPSDLTSDDFPIHEYEYVETTNSEYYGEYFILNQTCDSYDPTKTYSIGDYVKYNNNLLYICVVEVTSAEPFDPTKWKYLGNLIEVHEYEEGHSYKVGNYCIFNRKLYECSEETIQDPSQNALAWDIVGEYIKDIGFLYLDDRSEEQEIPYNVLPAWVNMHINRGTEEDFSDTTVDFIAIQNGLFKWDANIDWVTKEAGGEDSKITSAVFKSDTTISYLDSLPEYSDLDPSIYPYINLYDLSEIQQSETGNPEKVIVRPKQSGYYKVGSSNNYEYFKVNDIIKELSINQDLDITYLHPEQGGSEFNNIIIEIKPRWWSL